MRRCSVAAITLPSGMHSANASTFIAARQRMVCQFSCSLARIICVVCIVNIAAQKSALNTWICVIVRRTARVGARRRCKVRCGGRRNGCTDGRLVCCHECAAGQGEWPDYALAARGALQRTLRWRRTNTKTRRMNSKLKVGLQPDTSDRSRNCPRRVRSLSGRVARSSSDHCHTPSATTTDAASLVAVRIHA